MTRATAIIGKSAATCCPYSSDVNLLSIAGLLGGLILAGAAGAHGGVEVEADRCIMKIGAFKSHFTGYQPEKRAAQMAKWM